MKRGPGDYHQIRAAYMAGQISRREFLRLAGFVTRKTAK